MEYLMGFIAGVAIGAGAIGVLAANETMRLRDQISILIVDLKYARKDK